MNKFFSLVLFFPGMLIAMLLLTFANYQSNAIYEMQEIMLRDCADSANDAAMEYALSEMTTDVFGNAVINPEEVWYTYKSTFLSAMNLYSDRNMDTFEAYCPATIIAVNDGYYMRMRILDSNDEPAYIFSEKIPFARAEGDNIVLDSMDGSRTYDYNNASGGSGMVTVNEPSNDGTTKWHDSVAIATEIMQAMDYCITLENESIHTSTFVDNMFYVPSQLLDTLYYDTVTFEGFTLLNLIQNFDMKGGKPLDYFTITSTQIVDSTQYVCYTSGTNKYYVDSKLWDRTGENGTGADAIKIVSSKEEAALLGYSPYLD